MIIEIVNNSFMQIVDSKKTTKTKYFACISQKITNFEGCFIAKARVNTSKHETAYVNVKERDRF